MLLQYALRSCTSTHPPRFRSVFASRLCPRTPFFCIPSACVPDCWAAGGGSAGGGGSAPPRRGTAVACEIVHDFGLVRPGSVQEHRFVVPNDSDRVRRLARIRQGCTCTAAVPDEQTTVPRGTLSVAVKYRAGGTIGSDRRRVSLFFVGESVPVDLVVQANIRKPLTCSPKRLDAGHESGIPPTFVVSNYSGVDWDGLDIAGHKALQFEAVLLPAAKSHSSGAPRQSWRVSFVNPLRVDDFPGRGVESIIVTAKANSAFTVAVHCTELAATWGGGVW
ncbi:MAG: DUF1573 domain-containing protein [Planctomycetaceae bacterium]